MQAAGIEKGAMDGGMQLFDFQHNKLLNFLV